MQKKGAIEFSMTTIMVIIIGVAVLALGLAWIRGTFTQVGILTEEALENAETILGEVAFTGKISAPATFQMKKNDAKKFRVLVRNTESSGEDTYTLDAATDEGCLSVKDPGSEVKVKAGEVGELTGGVISSCPSNIDAIITIKVSGENAGEYATEAIAIQVR